MTDWPHAPPHRIIEGGVYMVTAGTINKEMLFNSSEKLDMLYALLLSVSNYYNVTINAWALMSNHYHIIVSVEDADLLKKFINSFHRKSAIEINRIDKIQKRRVWCNYWDSSITYQKSYYARLNYVNNNPVHHGIVMQAEEYRWCSEAYYRYHVDPAFSKTVKSFKYDNIRVFDKF